MNGGRVFGRPIDHQILHAHGGPAQHVEGQREVGEAVVQRADDVHRGRIGGGAGARYTHPVAAGGIGAHRIDRPARVPRDPVQDHLRAGERQRIAAAQQHSAGHGHRLSGERGAEETKE